MSSTLYRKYRPLKFSEIVGQQHIVKTLSNSIANKHIGHAYLFTGPRGTGKTTLARIFAKTTNCLSPVKNKSGGLEPCLKCENCQAFQADKFNDIIEIDAASNTGVDNIRELKENTKLPPLQGKFKVYIIDEVHMLSQGAFNALLKTLEEPPSHIIFILATTEIHKVPETIISRCQRFDFGKLNTEEITEKLSRIAKKEKIQISPEALEIIASVAEGGMRDAESLLGQIISMETGKITAEKISSLLGLAENKFIEKITELVFANKTEEALLLINQIYRDGFNLDFFAKKWLDYLRKLMIVSVNPETKSDLTGSLTPEQLKRVGELSQQRPLSFITTCIEEIMETIPKIKTSAIPQLPLELTIVKLTTDNNDSGKRTGGNPTDSDSSANETEKKSATKKSTETITSPEHTATKQSADSTKPKKVKKFNLSETIKSALKNEDEQKEEQQDNQGKISRKKNTNKNKNASAIDIYEIEKVWKEILNEIKRENFSLSMTLTNSKPIKSKDDGAIKIAVLSEFHRDIINKPENRLTIQNISNKITGLEFEIEATTATEAGVRLKKILPKETLTNDLQSDQQDSSDKKSSSQNSLLSDALNLLGGTVVEES